MGGRTVWRLGPAADAARGDYTKHQANDRTMEKDWSLLPTPDEVDTIWPTTTCAT
jgi:hypothetical protein